MIVLLLALEERVTGGKTQMTQAPEATGIRLLAWHGIFLKQGDCILIDAVGAGNRWKDSNDSGF